MWSNRQMRGFIGITRHFILNWQLESVTIACKRVKRWHTAEKIRQEYEEALAGYGLSDKVRNVLQTMLQTCKKKHCSFHFLDFLLRLKQNEKTALMKRVTLKQLRMRRMP